MNLHHLNEALTAFLKLDKEAQQTFLNLITQNPTKVTTVPQTDAMNKLLEDALRKHAKPSGTIVSAPLGLTSGYGLLSVQE